MKIPFLIFFLGISTCFYAQSYSLKGTITNESNQQVEAVTCILRNIGDSLPANIDQYNTMNIKANSPVFRLSFTYRFGNYKKQKVEEIDTSRYGR
ncbi:MAG: hypothetical protein LBL79_02230 [Prevotella sp.]|jgi:hypothetical protein|nr:hypothetical protein [Prevotella sp.]